MRAKKATRISVLRVRYRRRPTLRAALILDDVAEAKITTRKYALRHSEMAMKLK